ncbi:MAG: hypothetical protein Q9160_004204 [Pyrenula sp. 1 TL-2023]
MARYSKNFFLYLTHTRFANILRRQEPGLKSDHESLLGLQKPLEDVSTRQDTSAEGSIAVGPDLVDLFKQLELAMRQLRSTKRRYAKSDMIAKQKIDDQLRLDQLTYDELQEKFRRQFLDVLIQAGMLEADELNDIDVDSVIDAQNSDVEGVSETIEADQAAASPDQQETNSHDDDDDESDSQDAWEAFMEEKEAVDEQFRQAIKDNKARLLGIKDEADFYAKNETYRDKMHEHELSVERGESSLSKKDFMIEYMEKCEELEREEAEAEGDFWTAIHNAEARGMIVDMYVEGMEEEEQEGSGYGDAIDPAAPQPHNETLTAFEKRMGRWLSPLADPEELADVNQLDPIYPEDKLIDRDVVDSKAGLLFARPDSVEAPADVVLARASENR